MKYWWRFREWRRQRRCPPVVIISQYAQKTDRPRVGVSVGSANGSMSVFDYADTDVGNAKATLDAGSLADITKLPIRDVRKNVDPDQRDYLRHRVR